MQLSPLSKLPLDLIPDIIAHLEPKELGQLTKVCRTFRELINSNQFWVLYFNLNQNQIPALPLYSTVRILFTPTLQARKITPIENAGPAVASLKTALKKPLPYAPPFEIRADCEGALVLRCSLKKPEESPPGKAFIVTTTSTGPLVTRILPRIRAANYFLNCAYCLPEELATQVNQLAGQALSSLTDPLATNHAPMLPLPPRNPPPARSGRHQVVSFLPENQEEKTECKTKNLRLP